MESPSKTVPSSKTFSDNNRLPGDSSQTSEESGHVSVEATSPGVSDVQTKTPDKKVVSSDEHVRDIIAPSDKETDNVAAVKATVSPTLSAESLLSEDVVSDTISLGSVSQQQDDSLQSSQQTSLSASSSSSATPSIVSVPSLSSSMSSISSSSILPSAPTLSLIHI